MQMQLLHFEDIFSMQAPLHVDLLVNCSAATWLPCGLLLPLLCH